MYFIGEGGNPFIRDEICLGFAGAGNTTRPASLLCDAYSAYAFTNLSLDGARPDVVTHDDDAWSADTGSYGESENSRINYRQCASLGTLSPQRLIDIVPFSDQL